MTEEHNTNGWLKRLKDSLIKTSSKITSSLDTILDKKKLDKETLGDLEDLLITADIGINTTKGLIQKLEKSRFNQEITSEEVKAYLASEIGKILLPYSTPMLIDSYNYPYVILVVGANGSGKTTTIGKLASYWQAHGKKVRLVAGDTFRAAAVEQLNVWAERISCPIEIGTKGIDPASLIHDSFIKSIDSKDDLLIIDTAGRLHNKEDLMAELGKIIRVLKKVDINAPHSCLLVLDATIGQNSYTQVEIFKKVANISGIVFTKLDGTAKGGVVVSLVENHKVPIMAIGIGENIEDLRPFEPQSFANSLVGL